MTLRTENRHGALQHRERQHRKYTKRASEYWEDLIKTKRGKKKRRDQLPEGDISHPRISLARKGGLDPTRLTEPPLQFRTGNWVSIQQSQPKQANSPDRFRL